MSDGGCEEAKLDCGLTATRPIGNTLWSVDVPLSDRYVDESDNKLPYEGDFFILATITELNAILVHSPPYREAEVGNRMTKVLDLGGTWPRRDKHGKLITS